MRSGDRSTDRNSASRGALALHIPCRSPRGRAYHRFPAMIVSIRDIQAWCVWCGGSEFDPLTPGPLRLATDLKCTACGARFTYLQLLDQIGEEAIRRANRAMDDLKKRK